MQGGVVAERWFDGIWIGLQFSSGEHIVALNDGRVIRARAVQPRPGTVNVTRETPNIIKVGPGDPSEVITQNSEDRPSPSKEKTQPPQKPEPVPSGFKITQDKLEKLGFTKGCPSAKRCAGETRTTRCTTVASAGQESRPQ